MTQNRRRIAVLTSGGDAPGMNAAIRSVVLCGTALNFEVIGVERGYDGLMRGSFVEFSQRVLDENLHRGGTLLRSARSHEFMTREGRAQAIEHLRRAGIEGLVVIGGDGSFAGALALDREGMPTVGIPGTIDNDIACTDVSIGFDTALNTVIHAVNQLRDTAYSHDRVYVVEVMGRNSGYIALYSGLAVGAEAILIPEIPEDLDNLVAKIDQVHKAGKAHSIVIVAEGVGGVPSSPRRYEESAGFRVAQYISEHSHHETRVTILGHLQRGGSPTASDRLLASRLGEAAVRLLARGVSGRMVGIQQNRVVDVPLEDAIGKPKPIDREYYELASLLTAVV